MSLVTFAVRAIRAIARDRVGRFYFPKPHRLADFAGKSLPPFWLKNCYNSTRAGNSNRGA